MIFYYKLNNAIKQTDDYDAVTTAVLEYANSSGSADAIFLYNPVGSEPLKLEAALEQGLERIEAGHPAIITAIKYDGSVPSTVWEVSIWTSESA